MVSVEDLEGPSAGVERVGGFTSFPGVVFRSMDAVLRDQATQPGSSAVQNCGGHRATSRYISCSN